jgi:hypothetical protein
LQYPIFLVDPSSEYLFGVSMVNFLAIRAPFNEQKVVYQMSRFLGCIWSLSSLSFWVPFEA